MHECARPGGARFQLTEKIAVGTAKTPRARRASFSPFLCGLCAFAVQISGTAKRAVHEAGANTRMRPARWRKVPTYRENRGWNRQDAKSAKGFFFSFPLRPLRLCGSDLRDRQAGRPRMERECTNGRGAARCAPTPADVCAACRRFLIGAIFRLALRSGSIRVFAIHLRHVDGPRTPDLTKATKCGIISPCEMRFIQ